MGVSAADAVPAAAQDLPAVTTLRGLAALAVCWFHMGMVNQLLPEWSPLWYSSGFGWLGPHVFFIISGFIVPWSLHVGGYRLRRVGQFFAKRLLRLEPPYLITILLVLVIDWIKVTFFHEGGELLLLDWWRTLVHLGYVNAFIGERWLNPVFWTLAIEFQYYILVALLFPLLAARDARLRNLTMVLLVCAYLPFRHGEQTTWVFGFLPLFMNGFLLFQHRAGIIGPREFWAWTLAMVACSLSFTPVMCGLALLTVCLLLANRIRSRFTDFLGHTSYSLYLVHMPVAIPVQLFVLKFFKPDANGKILLAIATVLISIFAAWLFYLAVERPSQRWSKRLRYRDRGAAPVAAQASPA